MELKTHDDFYNELFKRNFPIISLATQKKLKNLNLLVAGCGSTGGAFVEGASRAGVLKYRLVEPDNYDLNNLNRQFVYPQDIGVNKAEVHAARLRQLFANCGSQIEVDTNGVTAQNVDDILEGMDIVFDAVDVTTARGMQAKLLLHEHAAKKKILVLSALDLGFKQWIRIFDYRNGGTALEGRMEKAKSCVHPLKALIEGFCPLSDLSVEIAEEVMRLLKEPNSSACQIGAACHLLAAFVGPFLIRFCEEKELPQVTSFDLMRHLESAQELSQAELRRFELVAELEVIFSRLP